MHQRKEDWFKVGSCRYNFRKEDSVTVYDTNLWYKSKQMREALFKMFMECNIFTKIIM